MFAEPSRIGNAQFRVASADYFGAMGIPLIRGRVFDARDTRMRRTLRVISASLAEAHWPGEDPLGRLIEFAGMDGDLSALHDRRHRRRTFGAQPRRDAAADCSTRTSVSGLAARVCSMSSSREEVRRGAHCSGARVARELDPQVPVDFRTLREVVSASMAQRQLVLVLLALFGVLALVLAATGVYGILSYRGCGDA